MHFPKQRVCYNCFKKDNFEMVSLNDQRGTVKSYTFDSFFPTPEKPMVVCMTEVLGARIYVQVADILPDEVKLELPVEYIFRRIHQAGGRPHYYWKCTPLRDPDGAILAA